MTDPSFDLTAEPWIPALDLTGHARVLTPLQLVQQAEELSSIGGELPTTGFALTRLVLAILHRSIEGPRDGEHWARLWETPGLPVEAVATYLDRWRDRFDLFSPLTPFHQVAGLSSGKGGHSGLEKLIADVPNGRPLFSTRAGRALARIDHAEAARWLVHAQAFDTAGIKSGASGDTRVKNGKGYPDGVAWSGNLGGLLVEGPTLRDTLLLNLLPYADEELALRWGRPEDDLPVWERNPLGPDVETDASDLPRHHPTGPADLYSWSSRRVRLLGDAAGVTGLMLSYGDRLPQHNAHTFEPMTAWRRSQAQEKALKEPVVYMPRQHDVDRVFWRGLAAVLPVARTVTSGSEAARLLPPAVLSWLAIAQQQEFVPADLTVRTRVTGIVYGAQSAVVDELVDDQLSVKVAVLRAEAQTVGEQVLVAVRRCEDAVTALVGLAGNLLRAAGSRATKEKWKGMLARPEEIAFAVLDGPFRRWVAALTPDSDLTAVATAWQEEVAGVVQRLADELVATAGEAAWKGRKVEGRQVDSGQADAWFRAALRKALPLASPTAKQVAPTTDREVA